MPQPDLTGTTVGRYRLHRLIGAGGMARVYHASQEASGFEVALKVLDPALAVRPGFMARFEDDASRVSVLGHPGIVRCYEYGVRDGHTYVSMQLIRGWTLKQLLERGPLPSGQAWRILSRVADALHRAHQVGVVHRDVKPSNVLIEGESGVFLSDFGLARTNYGFAVGTPGYMAPEQASGEDSDHRADVFALGVLVFEMLTGQRLYDADSTLELIMSTVNAPIPSASAANPSLPHELDLVLSRALAKSPADRPNTPLELLAELSRVPVGHPAAHQVPVQPAAPQVTAIPGPPVAPVAPTPPRSISTPVPAVAVVLPTEAPVAAEVAAPGVAPAPSDETEARLAAIFDSSLDAVVVADETGSITHWNAQAQRTFGWTQEEIVGRAMVGTIIPAQHREAHERGYRGYLASGSGRLGGKPFEATGLHRDGHEFPLELAVSLVGRGDGRASFVAFCRDITERRKNERMREAQAAVTRAFTQAASPSQAAPAMLESVCRSLGWEAGMLWRLEEDRAILQGSAYWQASEVRSNDFQAASRESGYEKWVGIPGRVWGGGQTVWVEDLLKEAENLQDLAALRSGLQSAAAFPVLTGSDLVGVVALFSMGQRTLDPELVEGFAALGLEIGHYFARRQAPAAPEGHRRYQVDPRHSRLGFSAKFMMVSTVRGHFTDFSGSVEMDGEPTDAVCEFSVRTASVETGDPDRDNHLRSEDFFASARFDAMTYRSTEIVAMGPDRYRVTGDLTIRDVTRPVQLEVEVEGRMEDPWGNERAALRASGTMMRMDWGLNWDQALEAGRWVVSEEIRLDLEVALVRRLAGQPDPNGQADVPVFGKVTVPKPAEATPS